MAVVRPSPLEQRKKTYLSPLALENRPRSSSTPVRFSIPGDDSLTLEMARVTSMPYNIEHKQYTPTPPQFKLEIKIINDGDCITKNDQKNNSTQLEVTNNCVLSSNDNSIERKGRFTDMLDDPAKFTTSL